jgi:hypothetical protein
MTPFRVGSKSFSDDAVNPRLIATIDVDNDRAAPKFIDGATLFHAEELIPCIEGGDHTTL